MASGSRAPLDLHDLFVLSLVSVLPGLEVLGNSRGTLAMPKTVSSPAARPPLMRSILGELDQESPTPDDFLAMPGARSPTPTPLEGVEEEF